jgi:hypothetical protein
LSALKNALWQKMHALFTLVRTLHGLPFLVAADVILSQMPHGIHQSLLLVDDQSCSIACAPWRGWSRGVLIGVWQDMFDGRCCIIL